MIQGGLGLAEGVRFSSSGGPEVATKRKRQEPGAREVGEVPLGVDLFFLRDTRSV